MLSRLGCFLFPFQARLLHLCQLHSLILLVIQALCILRILNDNVIDARVLEDRTVAAHLLHTCRCCGGWLVHPVSAWSLSDWVRSASVVNMVFSVACSNEVCKYPWVQSCISMSKSSFWLYWSRGKYIQLMHPVPCWDISVWIRFSHGWNTPGSGQKSYRMKYPYGALSRAVFSLCWLRNVSLIY